MRNRDGEALGRLAGRPAAIVTFLDGMGVRRARRRPLRRGGRGAGAAALAGADFPMRRANALSVQGWRPLFEPARARADTVAPGLAEAIEQRARRRWRRTGRAACRQA